MNKIIWSRKYIVINFELTRLRLRCSKEDNQVHVALFYTRCTNMRSCLLFGRQTCSTMNFTCNLFLLFLIGADSKQPVCQRHYCHHDLSRVFAPHCSYVSLFNHYPDVWVHPAAEVRGGPNGRGLFAADTIEKGDYVFTAPKHVQITAVKALQYLNMTNASFDTQVIDERELIFVYLAEIARTNSPYAASLPKAEAYDFMLQYWPPQAVRFMTANMREKYESLVQDSPVELYEMYERISSLFPHITADEFKLAYWQARTRSQDRDNTWQESLTIDIQAASYMHLCQTFFSISRSLIKGHFMWRRFAELGARSVWVNLHGTDANLRPDQPWLCRAKLLVGWKW